MIQALTTSSISRYSRDPALSFVLLNIKNRETSLSSTSYGIAQMATDDTLSVKEFKETIAENPLEEMKIGRKIIALTETITGSSA